MSFRTTHQPAMLLSILAMTLLATGTMAGDKEPCEESNHPQAISIQFDDDDLILTRECGEDSRVIMINLGAVEDIVSDAMGEVAGILEELDDMQVKIHLGEDNMLSFADRDTEWELDLNQIAMQVESALEAGFGEFESSEWTSHHSRHDNELDELKDELKSLRREMKQLEKLLEKTPPQENR